MRIFQDGFQRSKLTLCPMMYLFMFRCHNRLVCNIGHEQQISNAKIHLIQQFVIIGGDQNIYFEYAFMADQIFPLGQGKLFCSIMHRHIDLYKTAYEQYIVYQIGLHK